MDDLRKNLFYEPKNGYDRISREEHIAAEDYCRGYMEFLNDSRTEREAVVNAIKLAREKHIHHSLARAGTNALILRRWLLVYS